jgi:putative tricarboxylic transport membrane protein
MNLPTRVQAERLAALGLLAFSLAYLVLGWRIPVEENLRRALLVHDGSFALLWQRSVTAVLVLLSIACLIARALAALRRRRSITAAR